MLYLAEKFGRFWPQEIHAKYDVVQWVMWQMGNQGPKFGEQGHFLRAAQDAKNGDFTYANKRFGDEVHRLYGVMNLGLFNKRYLAASEYTIADMICYPWAASWEMRKIDLDEFPNVKRWMEELGCQARRAEGNGGRRGISGRHEQTVGRGKGAAGEAPLQPAGHTDSARMEREGVSMR